MHVIQKEKKEGLPGFENFEVLKALRESNFRKDQLIENLDAAIYTCDTHGFITYYNKAAASLWGREPVLGVDLWCGSWKIFRSDGSPLSLDDCPMAKTIKERISSRNEEIIMERPDGIKRHLLPHPDPLFDSDGNFAGAVNILVDITELKKKEYELFESESRYKQMAIELEQRVHERTMELNEANRTLKRTNIELEQFAYIASHDMQEPLRKIKNFVYRLECSTKDSLDCNSQSFLGKIKDAADRMSILIKDVLEFSRLGSLDNQFIKVDMNKILRDVINDFELSIEQYEAVITIGNLPVINAIPLQMSQLFHNLVSNSLKFSKRSNPCKIDVSSRFVSSNDHSALAMNPELKYCELVIRDNGIGFKQEYAEKVFKIFERLNGRDHYEGTGIGLALCRKIVTIHKGFIFAEAKENEETAIHVILPMENEYDPASSLHQ